MTIAEDGLSTRSLVICAVSLLLGMGSLVFFLSVTKGQGLIVNIGCAVVTLLLLEVSFLAWAGKFEKKPVLTNPEPDPPRPLSISIPLKEDSIDEWVKNYTKKGTKS